MVIVSYRLFHKLNKYVMGSCEKIALMYLIDLINKKSMKVPLKNVFYILDFFHSSLHLQDIYGLM